MPGRVTSRPNTGVHHITHDTEPLRIGQTLKDLRAARGLTQQDLADDLGISASYLSLLESGKRRTTRKILRGLSDYLNLPAGYFVIEAMQLTGLEPRHRDVIQELRRDLVEPALQRAFAKHPKRSRQVSEASVEAKAATTGLP
jgi:transcriptional regulator with XRE-family HTH domain